MAVNAGNKDSSTSTVRPTALNRPRAYCFCSGVTAAFAHKADMAALTCAFRFGMTRTMGVSGDNQPSRWSSPTPPAMEMTSFPPSSGAISVRTAPMCFGFTATTTASTAATSCRLEAACEAPNSLVSGCSPGVTPKSEKLRSLALTKSCFSAPAAIAEPMAPIPIKPSFILPLFLICAVFPDVQSKPPESFSYRLSL